MNAATERNIRSAFVLTNQDIQKLANSLQSFVGTPAFEIARRDGISRSFNDISSFLAFDNSRSKAIRSLWMSALSEDMKVAFHTGLAQRLRPFVSIFRGGEDTVSGLTDAILDRIDGMRPWFSSVARIDFTLLGFVTRSEEH